MKRPIQKGDRCQVISGQGQHKSPNLGLEVMVESLQGEHSRFGRIWRCTGKDVQQLTDGGGYVSTGVADFAQAWLRRLDDVPPTNQIKVAEELTA